MIRFEISRSPSRSSSRYSPPPALAIIVSDARSSDERIGGSRRRRVVRPPLGGSGMKPPTVVPTPTTNTGTSLVRASLQRSRHLAAPRLAVGDQHERLGVRRLAVDLVVLLDQPHAPGDAELDVGVPGRVVLEAERRFLRSGDRGRRRRCWDPCVSRTCGAAMCAKSAIAMRSSRHASDSPSMRRNRIARCQRLPGTSARRASTRSRPAG